MWVDGKGCEAARLDGLSMPLPVLFTLFMWSPSSPPLTLGQGAPTCPPVPPSTPPSSLPVLLPRPPVPPPTPLRSLLVLLLQPRQLAAAGQPSCALCMEPGEVEGEGGAGGGAGEGHVRLLSGLGPLISVRLAAGPDNSSSSSCSATCLVHRQCALW